MALIWTWLTHSIHLPSGPGFRGDHWNDTGHSAPTCVLDQKVVPSALVYTKLNIRWNWSHTFNSERRETLYCSFHSSRRPPGWNWLICYRSELTVPKGPRSILIRHRCPLRGLALHWQWHNHINLLKETEHAMEVTCWWFDWVRLLNMTVGILTKWLNWYHLYVSNYKTLKSTTKKLPSS